MISRRLLLRSGIRCSIATCPGNTRMAQSVRPVSTSPQLQDEGKDEGKPPTTAAKPPSKAEPQQALSSCAEGTILKGINYLKKLSDPVALPDEQYPPWLWTVTEYKRPRLAEAEGGLSVQDQAALYGKSKKKRQAVMRKMAAMGEDALVKKVTPDQQTVDMPYEEPFAAQEHRDLVRKFAKQRRRESIKEGNFLKAI